mmetsp:Transcript_39296/g.98377  ORF Transcript_39296/g.98377 Transcript_39296/m.98377 type:complete len:221 (+) Transcript_39296:1085-1747(+)
MVWFTCAAIILPLTTYALSRSLATLSFPGPVPSSFEESAVSRDADVSEVRRSTLRSPYEGSPKISREATFPFTVLMSTAVMSVTQIPFAPVDAGLSCPISYLVKAPAIVAVNKGLLPSSYSFSGDIVCVTTPVVSPSLKIALTVTAGAACGSPFVMVQRNTYSTPGAMHDTLVPTPPLVVPLTVTCPVRVGTAHSLAPFPVLSVTLSSPLASSSALVTSG